LGGEGHIDGAGTFEVSSGLVGRFHVPSTANHAGRSSLSHPDGPTWNAKAGFVYVAALRTNGRISAFPLLNADMPFLPFVNQSFNG
jgi:hypothetical protein